MIYRVFNGPKNTTLAPVPLSTGTALKTLIQIKPIVPCRIVEWGFSGSAFAGAAPGIVELIEVDVAATVTAFVSADITQLDAEALNFGDPTSQYLTVGTTSSGYMAAGASGGEGTVTTVRNLAGPQQIAPTSQFQYQSPLGYRGYCQAGKYTRIRAKFPATVDVLCYVDLEF